MPTDAQQDALKRLREYGGEGVIDKHGKVVASGERLMGLEPVTWLRLITTGYVEVRGHLRIGITEKGEQSLAQAPPLKVNPHAIKGERFQVSPRHEGAE